MRTAFTRQDSSEPLTRDVDTSLVLWCSTLVMRVEDTVERLLNNETFDVIESAGFGAAELQFRLPLPARSVSTRRWTYSRRSDTASSASFRFSAMNSACSLRSSLILPVILRLFRGFTT